MILGTLVFSFTTTGLLLSLPNSIDSIVQRILLQLSPFEMHSTWFQEAKTALIHSKLHPGVKTLMSHFFTMRSRTWIAHKAVIGINLFQWVVSSGSLKHGQTLAAFLSWWTPVCFCFLIFCSEKKSVFATCFIWQVSKSGGCKALKPLTLTLSSSPGLVVLLLFL